EAPQNREHRRSPPLPYHISSGARKLYDREIGPSARLVEIPSCNHIAGLVDSDRHCCSAATRGADAADGGLPVFDSSGSRELDYSKLRHVLGISQISSNVNVVRTVGSEVLIGRDRTARHGPNGNSGTPQLCAVRSVPLYNHEVCRSVAAGYSIAIAVNDDPICARRGSCADNGSPCLCHVRER